jgi:serine/threonine protein kinase, bacterial
MIGKRFFERYEVIEQIGSGGMQAVYAAKDILTERDVVLKTPLPGQPPKRFADSAVIAARVNHHNVAKTIDYFEEGDAQYLIEERIFGPNLEEALSGSPLDPHEGARLFRALALGIAASHSAGVVHRDLKPSNVVVRDGRLLNEIKITDFGIATLTSAVFEEAAKDGDITRSTSGTVKGALPYMAPEMMFRKKGDHPAEPADVWSLGAMMFKTLTGKYPFGTGFEAAANVKTGDREVWPPFMTSNNQFANLSAELQALVETCLKYSERDRPTANDIVQLCSDLCFADTSREFAEVIERTGAKWFARTERGRRVFFHSDSIYGAPRPTVGDRVVLAAYPGSPYPRAHPVTRSQ